MGQITVTTRGHTNFAKPKSVARRVGAGLPILIAFSTVLESLASGQIASTEHGKPLPGLTATGGVSYTTEPLDVSGTIYATGERVTLPVREVWRPICGSDSRGMTPADLKAVAEAHHARMADPTRRRTILDTPHAGRSGGLTVVYALDSSVPAPAIASFTLAKQYIESQWLDPITVTVNVTFAPLPPNILGQTGSNETTVSYETVWSGLAYNPDADDTIPQWLPTPPTLPVRYAGSSAGVTNEGTIIVNTANYRSTIGAENSLVDANMTYNTVLPYDFDPSDGVSANTVSLVDVIIHETGHAMGFRSGAGGANTTRMLDLFRFARTDRAGMGNTNPDTLDDFHTVPREVSFNDPNNDDVNSDLIFAEYRMSDGSPYQASHFFMQSADPLLAIGIMQPALGSGQTFYPNFFKQADRDVFDAIGWDYVGSAVWTQRPITGPSARSSSSMAYDAARGVSVLFGGSTSAGFNGETWEWNGTAWTQDAVSGPSPRGGHAMAYDAARGVTVLFGGRYGGFPPLMWSGETWEWNGTAWTLRSNTGPSPRTGHAMAFDAARSVTVLFGGYTPPSTPNGETWEWDGMAWTLRSITGPSPRVLPAMAFDSIRGVNVLFGGYNNIAPNGETWEWNGTAWTERAISGPSPRYGHPMAYDATRALTVLFGGQGVGADTWEWNGTVWTQRLGSGPTARSYSSMAYDSARGVTVLFGGSAPAGLNGETWQLGVPCAAPPFILGSPAAQSVCLGGSTSFTVGVASIGLISYQWQIQSAPGVWTSLVVGVLPLPCGGSATATAPTSSQTEISIAPCPGETVYQIRCLVTNACGSATSDAAILTLQTCCPADFNSDGQITPADIATFVNTWSTSLSNGTLAGDFDNNGAVNPADVAAFVTTWFNALTDGC